MSSTEELEALLSELQKKFDRLKVLYEQYFMGIEKLEPQTARKELTRAIMNLQQTQTRNSGLRFKMAMLIQKWNVFQSYWNRTLREIEQGRYLRHVVTAKRRAERQGLDFPAEAMGLHLAERHPALERTEQPEPPAEPTATSLPPPSPVHASHSAPSPPPAEAERRRPGSGAMVPGYSEESLRALHHRIVNAQRAAGDSSEMRYETLVAQLARQVPKLIVEHDCKGIEFDVVTRDGKVKLKPSPIR